VDFGISCNISDPNNKKIINKISGTLGYIDPFLVKQSKLDSKCIKGNLSDDDFLKSDLFSLGATLYQFVTGKELI
jgi:serine/threonine protein kinase